MTATDWLSSSIRAAAIERRLKSGQTLFHAGSKSAGLYEIVSGTVRLVRVDRSGREAVLQAAGAGETLAEASLFSSAYHCDAIATTDAVVRLYPKAVLLAELHRDPKFAKSFAAMLAHQVMSLRTRLERRNIHSARDRVRHFLTVNVGADGRTVVLPGTLKELAADLGLTHEALYRTLARMRADGEIARQGTVIKIERR
ncbi:MAG: Crp/Fnr family transcriptional regulator [Gemmatimonadota bacterium]|jgi:CRP-like cAMP-binding protein